MAAFRPVNDMVSRLLGLFLCRSSFFVIVTAGLILSLAGFWAAKAAGTAADLQMRRALVRHVTDIAAAVNPDNLRALSFTAEDKSRPEFSRLCSQLRAYAEFAGIDSLYTMALRNGQIVFGPESLAEGHPYSSPPGTVYQKPSQQDFNLFETGRPQMQGPFGDEYGTFVTASAPVFDPVTGEVLAAVGLDVEAPRWKSVVRRAQWIPAVITLALLTVLFLSGLILERYRRNPSQRNRRRKHAEFFLAAVFMILLTAVLAVAFDRNERISRQEVFNQLARTHAAACAQEFYNLRNRVDQLGRFFESSQEVTRDEFRSYCSNLINQGAISVCIWLPVVSSAEAGEFTERIRTAGLPEFSIWQKNKQGGSEPVSLRPVYYPTLYIEPLQNREPVLGYDSNSEPLRHAAIQEALDTGLATASDPIIPVSSTNRSPGFVIFKPVKAAVQNGLVGFGIRPENLLIGMQQQNKKNLGIEMCLFQLRHGDSPMFAAGSSGQCSLHCLNGTDSGLGFTFPVFRFGKTYALRLIPDSAWLAANPLHYGRTVGLFGLLITLLVSSVIALVTNRRAFLERQIELRTSELQASEKRFRDIIVNSSDWIWEVDVQGRYTYVSEKSLNLLGYTPEELLGRTPFDLMAPESAAKAAEFFAASIRNHKSFRDYENWNIRKDGRRVYLLTSGVPMFSEDGNLAGYRGTDTDITARKQAEDALRKNEAKHSKMVANIGDVIVIISQDGTIQYKSANIEKWFGWKPEELLGVSVWKTVHPDDLDAAQTFFTALLGKPDSTGTIECRYRCKDGSYKWIEFTGINLLDDPDIQGFLGNYHDITERRQAEEALRQSKTAVIRKLRAITEPEGDIGALELADILDTGVMQSLMDEFYKITKIGVGIIDLNGNVLVATGWQDICTQFHRMHPVTCQKCKESDRFLSDGVLPGESRLYRCKNNMWDVATPIMVGGRHLGNLFLGQFLFDDDIVDREFFVRQAREYGFNEQAYLAALDRVPRWSRDTVNTTMAFYTKLSALISGLSLSAIKLARAAELQKEASRKQLEIEKRFRVVVETIPDLVWLKNPDGVYLACNKRFEGFFGKNESGIVGRTDYDFIPRELADFSRDHDREAVAAGGPIMNEEWVTFDDDGHRELLETIKTPIFDEQGGLVGVLGIGRNITDRKQSEERIRQLAQHLETAREDERKRLARELHDDLGQILTALKIDLVLIEEDCSCTGRTKQKMSDMLKLLGEGIHSVHSLCRRLRPGALDDLGLEEAVAGLADDWQRRNGIECNVEENLPDEDLPDAIKTAVFRIIQEALTNVSRYAKASRVTVSLSVDRQVLRVSIADNGCGMEAGAEDKPTSFGLLGMRERIEALGGQLRIKSAPGKGTRIEGTIPV